jgi:prepilin-type N-terminal cleavage/methylation domain-containing protein
MSRPRRPGFTLLELLLASAIAVVLMGALYATLDIVLKRAEVNRDQIAASDLSRAIVNRLTADLSASVGLMQPMSGATATASSSSTTGTGSDAAATTSTAEETGDIPFQAGVIGTDKQVTVFASRLPLSFTDPEAISTPDVLRPGDLRRVTYYLGAGLCRQERPWVTADGVRNSAEPDPSTAETDVIAPEVTDATFEYFSGGVWNGEWDGSQVGTDGVTLQGPPRAIRVTLQLDYPTPAGGTRQKTVVHVIPVRAAVGAFVPEEATTTGGS